MVLVPLEMVQPTRLLKGEHVGVIGEQTELMQAPTDVVDTAQGLPVGTAELQVGATHEAWTQVWVWPVTAET